MIRSVFFTILICLLWGLGTLVILAPFLGLAWLMVRWTDLTMFHACLIVFAHLAIIYYLLRIYLRVKHWSLRWWGALVTGFSLIIVTLGGYVLRNWTDLTLFQAILAISGPHLLIAYFTFYSVTGEVPSFLRDSLLEEMWYDLRAEEWE